MLYFACSYAKGFIFHAPCYCDTAYNKLLDKYFYVSPNPRSLVPPRTLKLTSEQAEIYDGYFWETHPKGKIAFVFYTV